MSKCEVIGCEVEVAARGLCGVHYKRVRRHGSVELQRRGRPARPAIERVREKLVAVGGCMMYQGWAWGPLGGYVRVMSHRGDDGRLKMKLAHRVMYEDAHGEIPAGMDVLQTCGYPTCCKLEHLRLVTTMELKAQKYAKWVEWATR